MDIQAVYVIIAAVFSGGAAWGGVAMAMKDIKREQADAKEDRAEIAKKLDAHTAADITIQMDLVKRLSRIEGKLDKSLGD